VFVHFAVACGLIVLASVLVLLVVGAKGDMGLRQFLPASLATDVVLVGTALVVSRPSAVPRLRLTWGRSTPGVVLAAVLGTLALGQVLDSGITLAGLDEYGALADIRRIVAGSSGPTLAGTLLVIALAAGTAEELFFRGYMQTRLVQRYRPSTAILIASAAFALLHFDLIHAPLAFALGVWLGTVTERSDSVFPAMIAHVINNAVATLLAAAQVQTRGWINLFLLAVSFVVLVACARYLMRPPVRPARSPELAPAP
jgi:membrane protease YdiL (CAAX protease family)